MTNDERTVRIKMHGLEVEPVRLSDIPGKLRQRERVKELLTIPWTPILRSIALSGVPHKVTSSLRQDVALRSSADQVRRQIGLDSLIVLLRDHAVYIVPRDQWEKRNK